MSAARFPRFEPPGRLLMAPGPSMVNQRVLDAMRRPVIGHMDPETNRMLDEINAMLRDVFRTSNELTFPVSGTGTAGMECALENVLEPGDVALVLISGAFAERMAEIAARCRAEVVPVGNVWGKAVSAGQIEQALAQHPNAKAVCAVHAETSTGLRQPLEDIGALCRDGGPLFVVDAVASLGGIELETDGWGIDVCYSGSQKCLSAPPGLAPITFSERAVRARTERVERPRSFYFDVLPIAKYMGSERRYHHTAPISSLYALHEALRIVLEEGMEARWKRHQEIGAEMLAALEERGFRPFPPEGYRCPQVVCVELPEGMSDQPARGRLLGEFGIEVAGGLGELAGKVWRVGLMGESCDRENVKTLLTAMDQVLP